MNVLEVLDNLWKSAGFSMIAASWQNMLMILVACFMLYLAI
ncbi:MAG: glutaconyl-CoA decarboxylase subunit beta, partial [Clostridiaceae bacterium]|nr:glutaconyl-CoA decarboxylase subunit beta [Clostridiaceae bacterium]